MPSAGRATWSASRRNVLTPKAFADACADLVKAGLEVEILDREALQALGMNALLGVAQGSVRPPYVAVMRTGTAAAASRRWRWSARASASTPAASRSSRRTAWRT